MTGRRVKYHWKQSVPRDTEVRAQVVACSNRNFLKVHAHKLVQ